MRFTTALIAALAPVLAATACAEIARADWRATPVDPGLTTPEIVAELRAPAIDVDPDALPDGLVATGDLDIAAAWYAAPTRRYGHGVLGDAIEAGALKARTADGEIAALTLPESHVFEDRYPRIADLDGDGRAEIVTIRASLREGAGIVVYGLRDGALTELAAIPKIGIANRWLNVAAIADLNGDGLKEIAFVKTPHIGGTLRVFAFDGERLKLLDEAWGFSNHAIGARELRLSALADADGDGRPDLALPSADRQSLRIMALDGAKLREIGAATLPARIDRPIGVYEGAFVVGLSDGSIHEVRRR